MPYRVSATQLAANSETTEGSKVTLTANHCVLHKGSVFTPAIDQYQRDLLRGTFSRDMTLSGKRSANVAFDVEMVGQGNKGVAPYWGVLMKGCGMNEAVSANNSVTYTPMTSNMTNSLTLEVLQDGIIKRIWGARGTFTLTMEAGKPGLIHFAFEGCDFEVVDGALYAPTYPSIVPPVFLSAALLLDSYAAIVGKVDFNVDNVLVKRESINASSGYLSTLITGRNPKGTMDPELINVSGNNSYDFYGKWKTPGTLGSLALSANGNNGNIITITVPKVRYASIADQDRTGLRTLGLDFQACVNSADDEISIAIT